MPRGRHQERKSYIRLALCLTSSLQDVATILKAASRGDKLDDIHHAVQLAAADKQFNGAEVKEAEGCARWSWLMTRARDRALGTPGLSEGME